VSVFTLNIDLLLTPFFKQNRLLVFLFHWLAWLVFHFITFLPTLVNMSKISTEVYLYNHLALVTLNFLLFYVVAFTIMPRVFAFQNKWFWVLIASLLLVIFFTYFKFRLEMAWFDYLLHKNPVPDKFSRKPLPDSLGIFSYRFRSYSQIHILNNLSIVVLAFAYRLLLGWFQQEKVRKELENQKLQTELSYLKMQVNPHFLFNALNNIYSLAVIEDSKMTGNSILKLSDLLRYMLYEKEDTESKVSLDREIDHINSYIDLEKLRHLGQMYVNFSIEGDVNGKRIVPLLLFPLLENAFKHGILTEKDKPVSIDLKITDRHLEFAISNFKNNYQKDTVGGIGLQNVKKRLDLIYGEAYKFDIDQGEDRFTVNLLLPL
jgi:two-component system, LytTR family, sensor kinase